MHKTGTTALQTFFSRNATALAQHGICYPALGRPTPSVAHHNIANALKGPPFPLRNPEGTAQEYLEKLRTSFNSHSSILLSSEIFMRFVPAFQDNLKLNLSPLERFKSIADVVKVIIYLRRQDKYLESFYGQEIKHQLTMSFGEFVDRRLPDYAQICAELADVFGSNNVCARVYHRDRFIGGNIFADFLNALNLELTADYLLPANKVHPSIAADERAFKLLINHLELTITEVMQFNGPLMALSALKIKEGRSSEADTALFTGAERLQLLHNCEDVNQRLATRFVHSDDNELALFPAPGVDLLQAKVHLDLSEQALREILVYLADRSSELTSVLRRGIDTTLTSSDPRARSAAQRLKRGLD